MSTGFVPTPEKEKMQDWLWVPAIEAFARDVPPPLRILCLPGRECRFLIDLLDRGLTDLASITCIERDTTEALLIRGELARYARGSRPVIDLVATSVYDYLVDDTDRAIEKTYHVIDLDPYGRVEDEKSDLSDSVEAALDVQARANVRDWMFLLQTEVASARGGRLRQALLTAEQSLIGAFGNQLSRTLDVGQMADSSPAAQVLRYAACVAAWIADSAYPRFEASLVDRPYFYRGTDERGVPSRRALMSAFAFRMVRPKRPRASVGKRDKATAPFVDACVAKCKIAKAVICNADGRLRSAPLSALSFD